MGTYSPTPIGTLSNQSAAIAAINENFENIADVLSDKLDRVDGLPNQMERDLDMNSNHIVNVADPQGDGDAVNLRTLRNFGGGSGSGGVTYHGQLLGLGNDDHTQYFNAVRGDARYARLANIDPLVRGVLNSVSVNELGDVVSNTPAVGEVLKWNGTSYVNAPESGPAGTGANLTASRTATTVTVESDSGTDATLPAADTTNAGVMSAADKTKLNGIASGATVNSTDASLLARANHTGTQASTTIADFNEAVEDLIGSRIVSANANLTVTYNDGTGVTTLTVPTSPGGGATTLDGLTDVAVTTPATDQTLLFNPGVGGWVNGRMTVDKLADVNVFGGPAPGTGLFWDSTDGEWQAIKLPLNGLADVDTQFSTDLTNGPISGDTIVFAPEVGGAKAWKNMKPRRPVTTVTGATVQPMLTLNGYILRCTNAGGTAVTLTRADVAEDAGAGITNSLPGHAFWIYQDNTGGVTFSAAAGVTINYAPGAASNSNQQSQLIECVRLSTTEWLVRPGGGGASGVTSVNTLTGAITLTGQNVNSTASGTGAVARTITNRLNDVWFNVKDFGAVGNGSTNDSTAVQAALTAAATAGGTVFVPAGTYQVAGLTIASNVRLLGTGQGSILRAVAGMGTTTVILRNANQGVFTDTNITIDSIAFDGNGVGLGGSQTRFTELTSFARVTGLKVRGVTVTNTSYIGMAVGGCIDVAITNSSFTFCGFDGTLPETQAANGGPALWIATTGSDTPTGVSVTNCVIRDNRWSGMHFSVDTGSITGCAFKNNKEAHLFGSTLAGVSGLSNVAIVGNSFETLTRKAISGSAIELGGFNLSITGNTIFDCAHNGIALTDCQRVTVTGNTIGEFNKDITPQAAGVIVITTAGAGSQPRLITITGNSIYDVSGTGHAAVLVGGPGAAVNTVSITNNAFNGTWLSGQPIVRATGKWGANSFNAGNNGAQDAQPVAITWQPGTGTGNVSYTGLQFRPRRIQVRAVIPQTTKMIYSEAVSNLHGVIGTMNCQSFSAGTGGAQSGERGPFFYDLYDVDGTTNLGRATLVSFDETGFTINRTVSTGASTVLQIMAFP